MSELTSELRGKCDWCEPCQSCQNLMGRAAEEIDRLREEIDSTALAVCVAAGEVMARHRAEIERLNARLAVKCEHPEVSECAKLWQADTNHRQLASVSPELAAGFPWGSDTVEHLAVALLGSRATVARLREEIRCGRPASLPCAREQAEPGRGM